MWSCATHRRMGITLMLVGGLTAASHGQAPPTEPLARELVGLLDAATLDAIAAKEADGDDRFVAALAFPGQLLVVSARYEVPMYVEEKIANRQYREVYIDLNAASIPETKMLITDVGADGLSSENDAVDMVDTGSGASRFEGDAETAARYVQMLNALIAQAR